jgi:hypothetical protein
MFSKMRSIRISLLVVIAISLVAMPVLAQEAAKPAPIQTTPIKPPPIVKGLLDGKTFVGEMVEKGEQGKTYQETITFKAGKFHSLACDPMGFDMGTYKATKNKDGIVFTVKTTNKTQMPSAILEWNGTVVNDKATSTSTLTATAKLIKETKVSGEFTVTAKSQPNLTPAPTQTK